MGDAEDLGLIEDEGGTDEGSGEEGGAEELATEGEEEIGEGEVGDQGETAGEGEGGEEEGAAARTLPTQLRKALREFAAGNPDFAQKYPKLERQLTAAWFKAGQADKFGGFQKIREAIDTIEGHGGADGIREMAEEVQASRMMEEGFQAGDPVLIETWAKEYPDGFAALVGPAIAKLEALNLAAHDRAIAGPMLKALDRTGVLSTVADLETAIAGERFDDIQRHFGALKKFLIDLREFSTRARAPDPLKGDRDKLEAERTEFQTERQAAFRGDVQNAVNSNIMAFTNRLLRQALAGQKLRLDTANRVRRQINLDLQEAMKTHARNASTGYAERYTSLLNAGDQGRLTDLISTLAKQKLPFIVKRVLRDFNLGARPASGARRVGGSGGSRGTNTTVTGRPNTADVDFSRTDKATWLASKSNNTHGQAWLKTGKLAKW